jgi:hypothetical protein
MTARISSRVKSGCLAIRAKIQSECSSNGETLPPLRFGAALPVSLQRWHHRITELTPTLKISAISRRDAPLSTASTARSRKSVEYGLGIDLAPQANQFPQIRLGDSGWESLRFNADGKCSSLYFCGTTAGAFLPGRQKFVIGSAPPVHRSVGLLFVPRRKFGGLLRRRRCHISTR